MRQLVISATLQAARLVSHGRVTKDESGRGRLRPEIDHDQIPRAVLASVGFDAQDQPHDARDASTGGG